MKNRTRTYLFIFIASFIFYMTLFVITPLVTSESFSTSDKMASLLYWITAGSLSCFIFSIMSIVAYIWNIFIYGTLRLAKDNTVRGVLIVVYAVLDIVLHFVSKAIIATGTVPPMLRFIVHLFVFYHIIFFVKLLFMAYCRNQKVPETESYYKN